jgi:hypothetical protein
MARAKSLEETEKEISAKACGEVGTTARELPDTGHSEALAVESENEGAASSGGGSGSSVDDDGSSDESSRTYCFGASTITLSRIREMAKKGYFAEGEARAAGEETTPESQEDESIVFEDFFIVGLRMPPHPVLMDILLKL